MPLSGSLSPIHYFNKPTTTINTYIYETTGCCDDLKYYEIEQNADEAPLTTHPETGEAIKRVVLGGRELVKESHSHGEGSCGCGSSGCC